MSAQINHPDLAMRAARRMRKVKQKRKNSRVICHHLKMMLEAKDYHLDKNKNGLRMVDTFTTLSMMSTHASRKRAMN